jgi:hypothetical protein
VKVSSPQEQTTRDTRPKPPVDDEALLSVALVLAMVGGVSASCLWRWQRDPAVKFPPPDVVIKTRRYWRAGTVRRFSAGFASDGRAANRVIKQDPRQLTLLLDESTDCRPVPLKKWAP